MGGTRCTLTQRGDYPFDDHVSLALAVSQPCALTLRLRIPAWAQRARIEVNGRPLRQVGSAYNVEAED